MAGRSTRSGRKLLFGLPGALLALAALTTAPASASAPVHITSLDNAGPNTGHLTISIQGSGFQQGAHVRIGADLLTPSTFSSTLLTLDTPNIAPNYGFFLVEVDNPDGGRSPEHVTFNDYEQLPSLTPHSAAHAATHNLPGDQQLDVFMRGGDDTLRHTWSTQAQPAWRAWESLGGTLRSAPSAVSWGNQNRIDVFVRGTDNGLWHKWWDGAGWNGFEPLGGTLTSDPLVTSWGTGRLDVFGRGTDNQLWHRFYAGGWSGWEPLGGVLKSAPGGVSWGPNRIDVFVSGTDDQVWHKWWDGVTWNGWEPHPVSSGIGGAPDAASTGFAELDVYGIALGNTNFDLYHLPFSGSWGAWRSEGVYWSGGWAWSPGTVSQSFKSGIDTFEVASDNTIWHTVTEAAQPPHARVRGSGASKPRGRS
jgi:hypothetical protein